MFTESNYSEMIQGLRRRPELRDVGLNPFYENQGGFLVKVRSNNPKNTLILYQQQKKEQDTFTNVKNDQLFSKLINYTRVLLAESDTEILLLFKEFFELVGIESIATDNGDKALHIFQEDKEEGKKYNVVILNTQLKGTRGLDVAKKIHTNSPNQRIVLLTTTIKEELLQEALNSTAIEKKDILVMPFKLSQLHAIINQ
ncbi:response regulator [Candidatus Nitrosocosmicus sp. T]